MTANRILLPQRLSPLPTLPRINRFRIREFLHHLFVVSIHQSLDKRDQLPYAKDGWKNNDADDKTEQKISDHLVTSCNLIFAQSSFKLSQDFVEFIKRKAPHCDYFVLRAGCGVEYACTLC